MITLQPRRLLAVLAAALALAVPARAQVTIPYTFVFETTIDQDQVNSNFSTLGSQALNRTGGTMTGNLLFTDATYDIGASGATRPRDLFLSRNVVVGGTTTINGLTYTWPASQSAGYVLTTNGSGTLTWAAAAAVAGSDTQVQFNDGGALAGNAGLTFAKTTSTVTVGGPLVISGASAGQIVFPATQNPSSNVNTLDDYEEGSWTPTIGGTGGQSGQTYTRQLGHYVKIGKLVVARWRIVLSNKGTITGNAQLQSLPFAAVNQNTENPGSIVFDYHTALTTAVVWLGAMLDFNATTATIYLKTGAATGATPMVQADLSNTTEMNGTVIYEATN